jgi:hypothetical protein
MQQICKIRVPIFIFVLILALAGNRGFCQSTDQSSPPPAAPAAAAAAAPTGGTFDSEIAAAKIEADKTAKITHLRNALQLRPNDPQNIVIEFQIAELMSPNASFTGGETQVSSQSLEIFQHIVRTYDHTLYHPATPPTSPLSATDEDQSPEMMVPRAAVLAAVRLNQLGNGDIARKLLDTAMEDLQWTFRQRQADAEKPLPPMKEEDDVLILTDPNQPQLASEDRLQQWEANIKRAQSGELFTPAEMAIVQAAVRQYSRTFGPPYVDDVPSALQQIVAVYPDTPMAKIAHEHLQAHGH